MTAEYIAFFLKSDSSVVQFETIEISHPNFTKSYFVVRNKTDGLTATLETDDEAFFEYYPLRFEQGSQSDDLDYSMQITLGDVGDILPTELDAIQAANGFMTKPILKYRTFRSDDLSQPMFGPIKLEITEISFDKYGVTFEAKAPALSANKTGETYTIERFPMLKSTL